MESTIYEISKLKSIWPEIGQSILNGYTPDYISALTCIFFSKNRTDKWPSLQHTPNKGILLAGPKGIGKTINLIIYAKIACNYNPLHNRPRLVSAKEIQESYKILQQNGLGAKYIEDLVNCPELIIDDIGSEDAAFNDYGTVRNLVSDILILRYPLFQRGLVITHGTTNLNSESLETLYDPRLFDRMKEMFVFQIVRGESKRSNPIKIIPPNSHLQLEITEVEKRRLYLELYITAITDTQNNLVPFYDTGSMWRFLVKNNILDANMMDESDLKKEAVRLLEKTNTDNTLESIILDNEILNQKNSSDKLIDRNIKHLIMKRYFQNNSLDLSQFTDEEIML